MDFTHYSDTTVAMAVDLVNTLDPHTGDDALVDLEGLDTYLDRYRELWHSADWVCETPTDRDLQAVRNLRDRLGGVFSASNAQVAAERLNNLLADSSARPRVSVHGEGPHMHFEPARGDIASWLGSSAAMGLAVVLVDYGFERFGTCASSTCSDAFIDTSRNMSRKHCSTTCTTRENVAAHRARSRT